MTEFTFFLPLTKADEEKRLVWGRAAVEEPDKSKEIMDYLSAKPEFQKWSDGYSKATMGKSFGNIRAMHNPKHLAGKVAEIVYNDDAKAVDICVKVLDPVDWAKVEEGGYTGFSIGGGYVKKWADQASGCTRYTPRIQEISFVDSPCIPGARIMEMQKQDGSLEEVLLKGVPRSFAELLPPPSFAQLRKGIAGELAGSVAGNFIGSKIGAVAGSALGPAGTAVGHVVGGEIGSMAGSALAGAKAPSMAEAAQVAGGKAPSSNLRIPKAPKPKQGFRMSSTFKGAPDGGMVKRWDVSKHPREHTGAFASKTGEKVGRFTLGGAGAVGGTLLGLKHGEKLGTQAGLHASSLYHRMKGSPGFAAGVKAGDIGGWAGRRYGGLIGAGALGLGGALVGGAGGALLDTAMRRRRAKKAGRLEIYHRLNAKTSARPNSFKQVKASTMRAVSAGKRVRGIADAVMGKGHAMDKPVEKGLGGAALGAGRALGAAGLAMGRHAGIKVLPHYIGMAGAAAGVKAGFQGGRRLGAKIADKMIARNQAKGIGPITATAGAGKPGLIRHGEKIVRGVGEQLTSRQKKILLGTVAGTAVAGGLAGGVAAHQASHHTVKHIDKKLTQRFGRPRAPGERMQFDAKKSAPTGKMNKFIVPLALGVGGAMLGGHLGAKGGARLAAHGLHRRMLSGTASHYDLTGAPIFTGAGTGGVGGMISGGGLGIHIGRKIENRDGKAKKQERRGDLDKAFGAKLAQGAMAALRKPGRVGESIGAKVGQRVGSRMFTAAKARGASDHEAAQRMWRAMGTGRTVGRNVGHGLAAGGAAATGLGIAAMSRRRNAEKQERRGDLDKGIGGSIMRGALNAIESPTGRKVIGSLGQAGRSVKGAATSLGQKASGAATSFRQKATGMASSAMASPAGQSVAAAGNKASGMARRGAMKAINSPIGAQTIKTAGKFGQTIAAHPRAATAVLATGAAGYALGQRRGRSEMSDKQERRGNLEKGMIGAIGQGIKAGAKAVGSLPGKAVVGTIRKLPKTSVGAALVGGYMLGKPKRPSYADPEAMKAELIGRLRKNILLQDDNTVSQWKQARADQWGPKPFWSMPKDNNDPKQVTMPGMPEQQYGPSGGLLSNIFKGENPYGELAKKASAAEQEKIHETMHEFKHGKLKSFRSNLPKRKMPKVTDRKQAIAIALNQARRMGKSDDGLLVAMLADRLVKNDVTIFNDKTLGRGDRAKFQDRQKSKSYIRAERGGTGIAGQLAEAQFKGPLVGGASMVGSHLGTGAAVRMAERLWPRGRVPYVGMTATQAASRVGSKLGGMVGKDVVGVAGAGAKSLMHSAQSAYASRTTRKAIGQLSSAEHAQRVAAAKARWKKEMGHVDMEGHHKAVEDWAGKAILGRDAKVARAREHAEHFWHNVADAHAAHDKMRPHVDKDAAIVMKIPGTSTEHSGHLVHNPDGIGTDHFTRFGKPTKKIYLMHPDEVDDWVRLHGKKDTSLNMPLSEARRHPTMGAKLAELDAHERAAMGKSAPSGEIVHFDELYEALDLLSDLQKWRGYTNALAHTVSGGTIGSSNEELAAETRARKRKAIRAT